MTVYVSHANLCFFAIYNVFVSLGKVQRQSTEMRKRRIRQGRVKEDKKESKVGIECVKERERGSKQR